jgi:hypothetical protein
MYKKRKGHVDDVIPGKVSGPITTNQAEIRLKDYDLLLKILVRVSRKDLIGWSSWKKCGNRIRELISDM